MEKILAELRTLDLHGLYERDFLSLSDHTLQELGGVMAVADGLRLLRARNYDTALFSGGLALSFGAHVPVELAGACALLGLTPTAVPGGDPVAAAALADAAVPGPGAELNAAGLASLFGGQYRAGLLAQRPTVVALDEPQDSPVAALAFVLALVRRWGDVAALRGKKAALLWSEAPGGFLCSLIPLLARLGMEVAVAHPLGLALPAAVEQEALREAQAVDGRFYRAATAEECVAGASLLLAPDAAGPDDLWALTPQLTPLCDPGALTLREALAAEAAQNRPYVLAAILFLAKAPDPAGLLETLLRRCAPRRLV